MLQRRATEIQDWADEGPSKKPWIAGLVSFDETRHPLLPLLMAAIIPVLLLAGWMAYRAADGQRSAALQAASTTVDRVAERIAAEINAQVQVAQTLALSQALDRGDGEDLLVFRREAERLKAVRSLWHTVELDNLDGTQALNLLRPPGATLGMTADRASFDEVVRKRRPVVGGVGPVGTVSERRLVALRVPVMRDGTLRFVLTIQFSSEAMAEILRRSGIPPGWAGAVVDSQGDLITRSDANEEQAVGQPADPSIHDALHQASGGLYEGRNAGGVDVETVFRTMPDVGHWSVHLAIPRALLERPVYKALVAVAVAVAASLGLAAALAAILARRFSRARREANLQAAALLEASEDRGRLAVDAAGLGTWRWNLARDSVSGSERFRVLMALPEAPGLNWTQAQFAGAIDPADREAVLKAAQTCVDASRGFYAEFRVLDGSGTVRWLRASGRALGSSNSAVIIGVLADMTAPKRAEAERRQLLQRLSEAQEDVQGRIARELHDQVGQTVTGLSLGLKGLEGLLDGLEPSTVEARRKQVAWLKTLTGQIGRDIHRVAADLRPTALDDLGLRRALAAYAADWGERYNVAVDVDELGRPGARLPAEVETAVYRVAQEALTNVLRHASASHVSIVIEQRQNELRLVVEDNGRGFDAAAVERREATLAPSRRRLGLLGIRERLSLIGGTLQIESSPGAGTTLFIRVAVRDSAAKGLVG